MMSCFHCQHLRRSIAICNEEKQTTLGAYIKFIGNDDFPLSAEFNHSINVKGRIIFSYFSI